MTGNNSKIKTPAFAKASAGKQKSKVKIEEGFTLIELLVAMAVFATVITVVASIFTSVVGSQRKNIYNQEVVDSGRFVLESIGRSIRQSSITTPNGSGSTLTINHPVKNVVVYGLNNGYITEKSNLDPVAVNLTSDSVVVESLNFVVAGNLLVDNTQPRVTISISIRSRDQKPGTSSSINLQTTITPRNLQTQ